ncbi:uncharacterized protein LOC123524355 [Mercenaria mercenaria]|uniref:uncharacterized protein LOC123524355 n=1 Tax=Mercenaria mercenaria TaxID=6596 RepID=UPI00234E77E4|nr:uncharacterized protein LOC123524355 [Mercenaria mercenaria]
MFLLIFFLFGIVHVRVSANPQGPVPTSDEVECPVCSHLSFELRYMPTQYRRIFEQVLTNDALGLQNQACEANTVEPTACETPTFPAWMENKCFTRRVTMYAVGITNLVPAAEMDITLLVKGCHVQWIGEEGGCTNFEDLDAETQARLKQQLAPLRNSWDDATYSGFVCIDSA